MLSANASAAPELQSAATPDFTQAVIADAVDSSLGARDQALAISAVHFLIDGREVTLTSLDQLLEMEVGSSLQVVGIDYRLNGEEIVAGKIAFEGYLNKLRGSRLRTDYGDGRFGGHEQEGQIAFGESSHSGLSDAWKMEAGSESLTLVMVRYGADQVAVEDRITIRTQVGTPDFVIDPEVRIKGSSKGIVVGRAVKIYGVWSNEGAGTYRSYAEVDIYHESDPTKVVWSGALADVVEGGESDKGRFLNKVKRDGFSRNWMPDLGGTYTLKFYADPENSWNESDESNNVVSKTIEVEDLRKRSTRRDAFLGFGFNHHSVDDTQTREIISAVTGWRGQAKVPQQETNHSSEPDEIDFHEIVVELTVAAEIDNSSATLLSGQAPTEIDERATDPSRTAAIDAVLSRPEI